MGRITGNEAIDRQNVDTMMKELQGGSFEEYLENIARIHREAGLSEAEINAILQATCISNTPGMTLNDHIEKTEQALRRGEKVEQNKGILCTLYALKTVDLETDSRALIEDADGSHTEINDTLISLRAALSAEMHNNNDLIEKRILAFSIILIDNDLAQTMPGIAIIDVLFQLYKHGVDTLSSEQHVSVLNNAKLLGPAYFEVLGALLSGTQTRH